MTTTSVKKNNNKLLLIFTLIVIIALLFLGYFQLNQKNYQDELTAWLKDNQINYKALSVSNKGHFKISDIEVLVNDHVTLTSTFAEGDMSKKTGIEKVTFNDSKMTIMKSDIIIPNISVVKATIASNDTMPFMENMHPIFKSIFNAKIDEVKIPSLKYQQGYDQNLKTASKPQGLFISILYNNIDFKNLNNGLIENSSFESLVTHFMSTEIAPYNIIDVSFKTGISTVKDLNYKAIMTFFFEPTQDKNKILKLYGEQSITDIEYDSNMTIAMGTMDISQYSKTTASQIKTSPISIKQLEIPAAQWSIYSIDDLTQLANNPDKTVKLALNYLNLIDAVEPFSSNAHHLKTVSKADSTLLANMSTLQSYDELNYSYTGNGLSYEIKNLVASIQQDETPLFTYTMGNFSIQNFRIPELIKNSKKLLNEFLDDKEAFQAKIDNPIYKTELALMFIPRFDEINFDNIKLNSSLYTKELNITNDDIFSFDKLNLKANYSTSYIPTALSLNLKNLTIPLTLMKDNPFIVANESNEFGLNNLGYDKLTFSSKIDLYWDKEAKTLSLNNSTFDIKDLLTFKINGQLTQASEMLFSGNSAMLVAGITNLTFKSFDTQLNLDPIRTRYSAWQKSIGISPEKTYQKIAQSYDMEMLNNLLLLEVEKPEYSGLAQNIFKKLSKPVNDFILNGGTLEIIFGTKSPNGLSLADFIGEKDLSAALLEKIDFSAKTKH